MTTDPSIEEEQQHPPDVGEILRPVWRRRNIILLVAVAVALLTLGINFLLPVYYRASATLLPETEASRLSALQQFADVAELAGVKVASGDVSRLYPPILTSETVLRSVIEKKYLTRSSPDSVNLVQYFGLDERTPEENTQAALEKLSRLISSSYDPRTGMVRTTLEMREPDLAAQVLNELIAGLDRFMRQKKVSSATEQRKWIDTRLKEVEKELRSSEEALKNFREKNRRVIDSPQLLLEQDRMLRDVQVRSTIFTELKKQSEIAKIEEIKNISIVNVLDPAIPPVKKERPTRAMNTILMFVLTLVCASAYASLSDRYGARIRKFLHSGPGV